MNINRTIFGQRGVILIEEEADFLPSEEDLANNEEARLQGVSQSNRDLRDFYLSASDWTQGVDSPLTDEKKSEWASYRTSLRSLPEHENWPDLEDSDWPTQPS